MTSPQFTSPSPISPNSATRTSAARASPPHPGLIAALGELAQRGPVFAKETSGRRYPQVLTQRQFLARDAQHTFLIRHPRETIPSYRAVQPGAALSQIGFESLHEVFTEVARVTGRTPVVLDSADLIARPADIVRAYCERTGLGFRPGALTWQPGDRPEWQLSRDWHTEVAASSGFTAAPGRRPAEMPPDPLLNRYLGVPPAVLHRALPAPAAGLNQPGRHVRTQGQWRRRVLLPAWSGGRLPVLRRPSRCAV